MTRQNFVTDISLKKQEWRGYQKVTEIRRPIHPLTPAVAIWVQQCPDVKNYK